MKRWKIEYDETKAKPARRQIIVHAETLAGAIFTAGLGVGSESGSVAFKLVAVYQEAGWTEVELT